MINSNSFGSFYDTTSQIAGSYSNTMTFNSVDMVDTNNSIYVVDGSKIKVTNEGVYYVDFLAQFSNFGDTGGPQHQDDINIWLKLNGQNVDGSNGIIQINGINGKAVAGWGSMIYLNQGDYIESVWNTNDTQNVVLCASCGNIIGEEPSCPSIYLSISLYNL